MFKVGDRIRHSIDGTRGVIVGLTKLSIFPYVVRFESKRSSELLDPNSYAELFLVLDVDPSDILKEILNG